MQQLIITLVALLGMIVPVANSRMTKLFMRLVPPMSNTGRVAVNAKAWGQCRQTDTGSALRRMTCVSGTSGVCRTDLPRRLEKFPLTTDGGQSRRLA
jgi:hypothetical protein